MKVKDIKESGGSANPFAALASSIDFVIKQVSNLEKLMDGVVHGVPDKSMKNRVESAAGAAKGHVGRALSQLHAAREVIESRSDTSLPPAPGE